MSDPGADSLHAPNQRPNNSNPTSEVGSSPFVTLDQLIAIMNQPRGQRVSEEPKEVPLPEFNPENGGADQAAWCLTASRLMEERPIKGKELFLTVTRALKGTASQWLTQIPFIADFTWEGFKELFLARFDGKQTATSVFMKMRAESQLEGESLGAYGMRLRSLLGARWEHLTTTEIVNAAVLSHVSLRDERAENIALTSDVKTLEQFATEMNAFHYAKKRLTPSSRSPSAGPEAKRRKLPDPRIKCNYCGVPEHKIAEYRTRMKIERQETTRQSERSRPAGVLQLHRPRCPASNVARRAISRLTVRYCEGQTAILPTNAESTPAWWSPRPVN
jgi:hypothetical protein